MYSMKMKCIASSLAIPTFFVDAHFSSLLFPPSLPLPLPPFFTLILPLLSPFFPPPPPSLPYLRSSTPFTLLLSPTDFLWLNDQVLLTCSKDGKLIQQLMRDAHKPVEKAVSSYIHSFAMLPLPRGCIEDALHATLP